MVLVAVMLVLPVVLLVWSLLGAFGVWGGDGLAKEEDGSRDEVAEQVSAPLKQSLEEIAAREFGPVPIVGAGMERSLRVNDPLRVVALAKGIAEEVGGVVLPSDEEVDGGVRVIFMIPDGGRGEFARRLSLVIGEEFEFLGAGEIFVICFEKRE